MKRLTATSQSTPPCARRILSYTPDLQCFWGVDWNLHIPIGAGDVSGLEEREVVARQTSLPYARSYLRERRRRCILAGETRRQITVFDIGFVKAVLTQRGIRVIAPRRAYNEIDAGREVPWTDNGGEEEMFQGVVDETWAGTGFAGEWNWRCSLVRPSFPTPAPIFGSGDGGASWPGKPVARLRCLTSGLSRRC